MLNKRDKSGCIVQLKVKRRWGFYFTRILVIMSTITLTTLTAFACDPVDGLGDRYSLLITMLLTCVVFQQYVTGMVPKLHYLTFLDKYLMGSYFLLLTITFEVFMSARLKITEETNTTIMWYNIYAWCFMHVVTVWYGKYLHDWERTKLEMSFEKTHEVVEEYTDSATRWGHTTGSRDVSWMSLEDDETLMMGEAGQDRVRTVRTVRRSAATLRRRQFV